MKLLTAQEARDLTELSGMDALYDEIAESARIGKYAVEVTELTEFEFKQLISGGFRIYADNGTTQIMKYDKDYMDLLDSVFIDWEV